MTATPKIHRPTTTLLALAALAVIAAGCGKTAERKDAAPVADAVQIAMTTIDNGDGTFTDTRDGQVYRTVVIGQQRWIAENLNFVTDSSACYDNADSNCTKYGRLYNWNDAMKACPAGWRLPGDEEWDRLALAAGGQRVKDGYGGYDWKFAGKKLKSTTGWKDREDDDGNLVLGNGTDEFGFSALPGGSGNSGGGFSSAGDGGSWWSATENDASLAWFRFMNYNYDGVGRSNCYKTYLYSVRCVRDFAAPQ